MINGIPAYQPPDCGECKSKMLLISYENKVALYQCQHCQQKVAIGEGRK